MIDSHDSHSQTVVSIRRPTLLHRLWLQMPSHNQDAKSQKGDILVSLLHSGNGDGDASFIFMYSQWFTHRH